MHKATPPFDSLQSLPQGWSIEFFDTAQSSNDLALQALIEQNIQAEGACFVVGEQTKGRGRMGRQWTSQPGDGLYFSAILCPSAPRRIWPSLSFCISLALYKMLAELIDPSIHDLTLKWPNDVLVNGGKIAGILLEATEQGVIAGCGLNLKNPPVSEGQKHPAVALEAFTEQAALHPKDLAPRLVHKLAECYDIWTNEGHEKISSAWQAQCSMVGQLVRIQTAAAEFRGICQGFDKDGGLLLVDEKGQECLITAGDVKIMKDSA